MVDEVYRTGDTVGGIFEVVAHGLPPGLGSHITWDSRLDGNLAQAIVSMQAVKGVEVGWAEEGSKSFGSKVQDTIHYDKDDRRFFRGDNRAGGLEGGMTNGQDLRVRGFLKPISTLRRPLESVDLETREPAKAAYERSDVCVVPAAGVIGEAMVAIVLGQAMLEKFGGDSLDETKRNFDGLPRTGAEFLRWFTKSYVISTTRSSNGPPRRLRDLIHPSCMPWLRTCSKPCMLRMASGWPRPRSMSHKDLP